MKNMKIHIHELGLIRNAEIELAPIMIFTEAFNLGHILKRCATID